MKKQNLIRLIRAFTFALIAVILVVVICNLAAIKSHAATILPWSPECENCSSTIGSVNYYKISGINQHTIEFYCSNCMWRTQRDSACNLKPTGYSNSGEITHQVDYICTYCSGTWSEVQGHDPLNQEHYSTFNNISNTHHTVTYSCICGYEIRTATESHYFSNISHTYQSLEQHLTINSCICGAYYSNFGDHDGIRQGLKKTSKDGHSFEYYCQVCGSFYEKLEDHTNTKYMLPCPDCNYEYPTDYKMDINVATTTFSKTDFAALSNDSYHVSDTIQVGNDGILNIWGWIAINGGVRDYTAQVLTVDGGNDSFSCVNHDSGKQLSDSIVNNIAKSGLDIMDFNNNAHFNLKIDLTEYYGRSFVLAVYAKSRNDQQVIIAVFNSLLFGTDAPGGNLPVPVPPDTEDESEVESNSGVITPDEPDDSSGSYLDGYAAGYRDASELSAVGVLKNGVLVATFNSMPPVDMPDQSLSSVSAVIDPGSFVSISTLNFKCVWNEWTKTPQYKNGNTLLSVSIQYSFGIPFEYKSNLIYFNGSNLSDSENYTLPTVYLFDIYGEAFSTTVNRDTSAVYNRLYISSDFSSENDLSAIQIDIPMIRNIEFWLTDYELELYVPKDVISVNIVSFNKGVAAGEKVGFQKGKAEGEQVATDKAYSEGKADGYDEGKQAGIREEQSNEIRQDFKWYDMFFSMFDAQVNVFRSIVNFEIFGVNVAGFVLGLVTIGIIAFIIRKVW